MRAPRPRRPVRCNDVDYPSIAALARAHGHTPKMIRPRIDRGMTPEEAVATAPASKSAAGRAGKAASPWRNGIHGLGHLGAGRS